MWKVPKRDLQLLTLQINLAIVVINPVSNSKAAVVIRRGKTGPLHRSFASQCAQSTHTRAHAHAHTDMRTHTHRQADRQQPTD